MCKHLSKFKQTQIIIMVFVLFGLTQSMLAQKQDITGTVKSESGEVLPGVTILTKESKSTGTATDFDGNFSLKVPEKVNTLIFSYVGFTTRQAIVDELAKYGVIVPEVPEEKKAAMEAIEKEVAMASNVESEE